METEQWAGELPLATLPYVSLCFVNFQGELLAKTPCCAPLLALNTGDLNKVIIAEDWDIFSQQLQVITHACDGYTTQFEIRCCNIKGDFALLLWQVTRINTGFYAQLTDISAYYTHNHSNLTNYNQENHYQKLLFEQNLLGVFQSLPEGKVIRRFLGDKYNNIHDLEIRAEGNDEFIYAARNAAAGRVVAVPAPGDPRATGGRADRRGGDAAHRHDAAASPAGCRSGPALVAVLGGVEPVATRRRHPLGG